MHDVSIVEGMLRLAEEQARKSGGSEIVAIRVRVGLLSGVVPEALDFAFETLKVGTMAERSRLEIEKVPAVFACKGCGKEWRFESPQFDCPGCGGMLVLRGSASELELAELEIT